MTEREEDREAVENVAAAFLNQPMEIDKRMPFILHHPFLNTPVAVIPPDRMLDLRRREEQDAYREWMRGILRGKGASYILTLLQKPYRLAFLKYIRPHVGKEHFGRLLVHTWPTVEAVTTDPNVSRDDIVDMFRSVPKDALMEPELCHTFERLPETFFVYRGVTSHNEKARRAVSWTSDICQAQWFATRFHDFSGEIWQAKIHKRQVLALINSEEKELIVDMPKGKRYTRIDPYDEEAVRKAAFRASRMQQGR